MDFLNDVVLALVSVLGTVLLNYFATRRTVRVELQKLGFQYSREDTLQLRDAYAKTQAAVAIFLDRPTQQNKHGTLTAVSELMAIDPGKLRKPLFELRQSLMQIQLYPQHADRSGLTKVHNALTALDAAWLLLLPGEQKKKGHNGNRQDSRQHT